MNKIYNIITSFLIVILAANALPIINSVYITSNESYDNDKILICTSTGFKYVSVDDLQNNNSDHNDNQRKHCPLCIISNSDSYHINITPVTLSFSLVAYKKSPYNGYNYLYYNNPHNLTVSARSPPHIIL